MPEDTLELEVVAPSAVMALERAAIDSQIATAKQYPRSLSVFQKRALEMVTLDEETAESCIYIRPVGKGKDGKQQYAEGASIRLAEIVAACYGNLRVASRIVEQTPRYVKCEGVAHDLESNYAGKAENMEATVTREGAPFGEAMRAVVAKAALAKAYRDAVFKVVPKALCKKIIDSAKATSKGDGKTLELRRAKAQQWVATLKVKGGKALDEKRVFAALGVKGWADCGDDELFTLAGLRTSINDSDVTVDDAFPAPDASVPKSSKPVDPFQKPAVDPDNPESYQQ